MDPLALDDFGAQSDTPWAREKLYQLVNYGVNNDLPMALARHSSDSGEIAVLSGSSRRST